MILPNKFITLNESIISKMLVILEYHDNDIEVHSLYEKLENKYDNIDEFLYSIDLLYVLDLIEIDFIKGVMTYVKRN